MDSLQTCPWGLVSLGGVLAVLVVVPSHCVEISAGTVSGAPNGPGIRSGFQHACWWWLEALLALAAFGLAVSAVVWAAMQSGADGGSGCFWLHLLTRLAGSLLLLLPPTVAAVSNRRQPLKSAWGPYALNGLALLLVAGAGRLYGERSAAAWAERDAGLLLEAGTLGTLALLAIVKALGVAAAAAAAAMPVGTSRGRRQQQRRWLPSLDDTKPGKGTLKMPLLSDEEALHLQASEATASAAPAPVPAPTPAPLDRANMWSRLVFGWVGPLLRTGATRQLDFADVPGLAKEDGTERWAQAFDAALQSEREGARRPSLLRAARRTFGADFYAFAGLQLINDLLGFSGPVLLKVTVTFVQDYAAGAAPLSKGWAILAVLLGTYAGTALLSSQYNLRMARLQLRVRTALVAAVYGQVLRCRAPQLGGLGAGEVTNLISVDAQRVQDAASSFNSFWSLPLQVALTLYLLYREVSYAFVAGVAIMAAMVPLNIAIAKAITSVTRRQMVFKDERVRTCDEMLQGIRALKMLAWEPHLAAALARLRGEEVRCLARRKYLDALCVIFWAATPVLTSLGTFAAVVRIEHDITPAAVFTTIALLNMLTFPLNAFPWILNGLMEARVSQRRLQRFLLELPPPPDYVLRLPTTPSPASHPAEPPLAPAKRRALTIEGIFHHTSAAAAGGGGSGVGGGRSEEGEGADAQEEEGPRPPALKIHGSFAWEEPPGAPPLLPPSLEDLEQDDFLGSSTSSSISSSLGVGSLPERVVEEAELEGSEALIPPCEVPPTTTSGGSCSSNGDVGAERDGSSSQGFFALRGLHLRVGKGEIVGVYGRVGSGKSSLLLAAMGEMYALPDSATTPTPGQGRGISSIKSRSSSSSSSYVVQRAARVAYVAQSPFLQRLSIRDNIVFGQPWDAERFAAVVAACGLEEDLAALPGGAEAELGEGGGTLSGGQRLRVALARALYSRAELYLLDDPFSGLDGRTAAHVAREAVHGMMRREGAAVLLVTHSLPLLVGCDWAVAMRGGRLVERIRIVRRQQRQVAEERLHSSSPTSDEAPHASWLDDNGDDGDLGKKKETGAAAGSSASSSSSEKGTTADRALAAEETREEGKVRWGVYADYWTSAGRLLSLATVVSLLGMQLSANAMSLWLSAWSAHTGNYSPSRFLAISGTIAGVNSAFTILRAFLFAWGGLRAARRLHDRLLASVLRAAVAFFEAQPVGRLLNRFAGDTWTIDDSLPFIANILLAQGAALLGTTVVLLLASPWTLLVLVLVAPLYHRLQAFYRASSRELKRLDSVARSPVLAHFGETMAGAVTVRAFGAGERFRARSLALVDGSQRVAFYGSAASQWLALRIQAFGVVVVASVAAWAVGSCAAKHPARPELIGLALGYASGVLGNLGGLLSAYAETEREMVAVERVKEFIEQPPEPDVAAEPALEVAPAWPTAGAVSVQGLSLRYRPGWPLALDHVSLRIEPGEKVALCGRTGSGKSSVLACLFRLVPWEAGSAISIDGVRIDRVPLQRLRSSMAIIPQEPTLFAGTVRSNLDPRGEFADAELFSALRACQLDAVLTREHRAAAAAAVGGVPNTKGEPKPLPPPPQDGDSSLAGCLSVEVKERGSNFSVGERQLICLCRSLLRKARVVCIDEATASLDAATDALVRRTIARSFQDATVITIAHRMSTVLELCTRVCVLAGGRLVEEGDPKALLADPSTHLSALSRSEQLHATPAPSSLQS